MYTERERTRWLSNRKFRLSAKNRRITHYLLSWTTVQYSLRVRPRTWHCGTIAELFFWKWNIAARNVGLHNVERLSSTAYVSENIILSNYSGTFFFFLEVKHCRSECRPSTDTEWHDCEIQPIACPRAWYWTIFVFFFDLKHCRSKCRSKHTKVWKQTLFIRTRRNQPIFGVIPIVKLQNNT